MTPSRFTRIAVALALLSACGGVHSQSGDAGSGGAGGSGGSSCASCGKVVSGSQPSTALCTTSANLFESLQTCACDQGPCGADCANSLCNGAGADAACKTCLSLKCASANSLCSKDASKN
jgi:hypothetical protein